MGFFSSVGDIYKKMFDPSGALSGSNNNPNGAPAFGSQGSQYNTTAAQNVAPWLMQQAQPETIDPAGVQDAQNQTMQQMLTSNAPIQGAQQGSVLNNYQKQLSYQDQEDEAQKKIKRKLGFPTFMSYTGNQPNQG